jgi:adenosylcobinamide-GDP ribazoletransferase
MWLPMPEISQNARKWIADGTADVLVCLRFCTRLPIKTFGFESPPAEASIAAASAMLPIAGALIGLAGAIVLWIAVKLGLSSPLAALLAIAALILITGALHEDGLADFGDGLGGATPEERLAIMKDSRIGTFGGLALLLVVFGRIMAVALLADHSVGLASTVLIAAGASSRCFALAPLYLLTPARSEGLGAAAAAPKPYGIAIAVVSTLIINMLPLFAGAGLGRVILALILSAAVAYGVTAFARRLLQGQTGDVAGATQQLAELTSYIVFSAHL